MTNAEIIDGFLELALEGRAELTDDNEGLAFIWNNGTLHLRRVVFSQSSEAWMTLSWLKFGVTVAAVNTQGTDMGARFDDARRDALISSVSTDYRSGAIDFLERSKTTDDAPNNWVRAVS